MLYQIQNIEAGTVVLHIITHLKNQLGWKDLGHWPGQRPVHCTLLTATLRPGKATLAELELR